MKAAPPTGVMAPKARLPVKVSRYRLPENNSFEIHRVDHRDYGIISSLICLRCY